MPWTDIEDGGYITPRRPTRYWSPAGERPVGVAYPFPKDVVASCAGQGDLFFPEGHSSREDKRAREVLCANCPLFHSCGEWARDHREHGIWAGRKHRP